MTSKKVLFQAKTEELNCLKFEDKKVFVISGAPPEKLLPLGFIMFHGHGGGSIQSLLPLLRRVRDFVTRVVAPMAWEKKRLVKRNFWFVFLTFLSFIIAGGLTSFFLPNSGISDQTYRVLCFFIFIVLIGLVGGFLGIEGRVDESRYCGWYSKDGVVDSVHKTFSYIDGVEKFLDSKQESKDLGRTINPVIGGIYEGAAMAIELMLRYGGRFSGCCAINPDVLSIKTLNDSHVEAHAKPILVILGQDEAPAFVEGVRQFVLKLENIGFNVRLCIVQMELGRFMSDELLDVIVGFLKSLDSERSGKRL